MSTDENKINTPVERISFFRSYYEVGEMLETNEKKGIYYSGILNYAFSNGEKNPDFQTQNLKMAWAVIKKNMDCSLNNRRPKNQNAKKNKNANQTRIKRELNANAVYDKDEDKDKYKERTLTSSKETPEAFSLPKQPSLDEFCTPSPELIKEQHAMFADEPEQKTDEGYGL